MSNMALPGPLVSYPQTFLGMMHIFSSARVKDSWFHDDMLQEEESPNLLVFWNPNHRIRTTIKILDNATFFPLERPLPYDNYLDGYETAHRNNLLWGWKNGQEEVFITDQDSVKWRFDNSLDLGEWMIKIEYRPRTHELHFLYGINLEDKVEMTLNASPDDASENKLNIISISKESGNLIANYYQNNYKLDCYSRDVEHCNSELKSGNEYNFKNMTIVPNKNGTLIKSRVSTFHALQNDAYEGFLNFKNKTMPIRVNGEGLQFDTLTTKVTVSKFNSIRTVPKPAFTFPLNANSTLKFYSKQHLGIQQKSRSFIAQMYNISSTIPISEVIIGNNHNKQLMMSAMKENIRLTYDEEDRKKLKIQDEEESLEVIGIQELVLSARKISIGARAKENAPEIVCHNDETRIFVSSNIWRIKKSDFSCEFYPSTQELLLLVNNVPQIKINLTQREVEEYFTYDVEIELIGESAALSEWKWTDKNSFTNNVRIMHKIAEIKFHELEITVDLARNKIFTKYGAVGWLADEAIFAQCDFLEASIEINKLKAISSISASGRNIHYVRTDMNNGIAALYKHNDTKMNFQKIDKNVTLVVDKTEVLIE